MLFQISEISRTNVIIIYISRSLNMFDRCSQNQPHKSGTLPYKTGAEFQPLSPHGEEGPAGRIPSGTGRLPQSDWSPISHKFLTNLLLI